MSSITKSTKKQLRWADTVTTNDAATERKQALTAEMKCTTWYNSSDFKAFSSHNKDLVQYAQSAAPQTSEDWEELEYYLNMHGHSLRGIERINGMPMSEKRHEKKELAIYGVMEALKMYQGDDEQISMIANRLSSYSVKVALEKADIDEVALIRFPADELLVQATPRANESTSTNEDKKNISSASSRKSRIPGRSSAKAEIVRVLKTRLSV
eukprot:CAMPEP_0116015598 /NCGR_PEP_ID=MMETSP0321-20121206/6943_1 /TAXON_ID=163516 /ORGANISM="Leptocylindrus danicus var. danicus, Strain B650" /LENGTH=210 /DNA_ID=CAMNT_0003485421 /DNA_START=42 /DNA_END=671 /DNA_ORIENTATION=+